MKHNNKTHNFLFFYPQTQTRDTKTLLSCTYEQQKVHMVLPFSCRGFFQIEINKGSRGKTIQNKTRFLLYTYSPKGFCVGLSIRLLQCCTKLTNLKKNVNMQSQAGGTKDQVWSSLMQTNQQTYYLHTVTAHPAYQRSVAENTHKISPGT